MKTYKTYKKSHIEYKDSRIFAVLLGFSFVFALIAILTALIKVEMKDLILTLSMFLSLLSLLFSLVYGTQKEIRLCSPQPGETIDILFRENVEEGNKQKTFYLYLIDKVIYLDEIEPTLLEIWGKYFVNKDGELELKG